MHAGPHRLTPHRPTVPFSPAALRTPRAGPTCRDLAAHARLAGLVAVVGTVCVGTARAQVTRESVGPSNVAPLGASVQGNAASDLPQISPGGTLIVFRSSASNWQDGTQTGLSGSRVLRRTRGVNALTLLNGYGTASPPLSGSLLQQGTPSSLAYRGVSAFWVVSGNWGAPSELCPDNNGVSDIASTGAPPALTSGPGGLFCPTQSDGNSQSPAVSPGGQFLVFQSQATTFQSGANGLNQIYTRSLSGPLDYSRKSIRTPLGGGVIVANGDSTNPAVGGGQSTGESFVYAFESLATNLSTLDTNGVRDIYARVEPNPAGSGLSFTELISVSSAGDIANGASFNPAVSGDGRFVAFASDATNLVPGDTNSVRDVFLRDRQTGTTTRISRSAFGGQANALSDNPAINSDGSWVAFESLASNLDVGPTLLGGGVRSVYLLHVPTGSLFVCSFNYDAVDGEPNASSSRPSISNNGRTVAFESLASNIVSGDTNGVRDVFVYSRPAAPANDDCAAATAISGSAGSVSGSTLGAFYTPFVVPPPGLCGDGGLSPDVWFRWTAPCTGTVSFTTAGSDYDTNLSVFPACPSLSGSVLPLACNDDVNPVSDFTSALSLPVTAGTEYLVRVGGFENRVGGYTLNWAWASAPPANDERCAAVEIVSQLTPVSNCGATTPPSGPALLACGATTMSADVWFRFTPAVSGPHEISLCSGSFDSIIALYPSTCPAPLGAQLACNDDGCGGGGTSARVIATLNAGASYSIRVGGKSGGGGGGGATGTGLLLVRPVQCNPADIATTAGDPGPDGQIDNGDFQLFFSSFFAANCPGCGAVSVPACGPADIADTAGIAGADGCADNGDFQLFFSSFFAGCP